MIDTSPILYEFSNEGARQYFSPDSPTHKLLANAMNHICPEEQSEQVRLGLFPNGFWSFQPLNERPLVFKEHPNPSPDFDFKEIACAILHLPDPAAIPLAPPHPMPPLLYEFCAGRVWQNLPTTSSTYHELSEVARIVGSGSVLGAFSLNLSSSGRWSLRWPDGGTLTFGPFTGIAPNDQKFRPLADIASRNTP